MVKLALILYQIYISPNTAGLRLGALSAAFHFFGNARFYAIGAGAPATVLSRYAMGYPKNAFF